MFKSDSCCSSFLNDEEKSVLENQKTQIEFLPNEVIFKQGALSPNIYYVISGYIKVYLEIGKTKRLNIYIAKPGDFLSLTSLFNTDKYKYSASALTDSTLCIIDKNTISSILSKNHNFLSFITGKALSSESRFIDVINNISYKQMRGKLASTLLYLTDDSFSHTDITQYISRQDLADFSGITVENTVSILKELKDDKIVDLKGKTIKILDRQRLSIISQKG